MAGFFYNLGKLVGPKVRKANWVLRDLTGTEADAIAAEEQVGRDLAQSFLRQLTMETDPAVQSLLDELGGRLANCLTNRQRRFQFFAARSAELNAFALPGGFIFVMRPLLEFCYWDRDELAFVLAHEIGHVVRRHAIDRLMTHSIVQAGVGRLPVGGALRGPVLNLAATLINQGYSQDQELDADNLGAQLTRAAGFDAAAAGRLLRRFQTVPTEARRLSSYLSSHPPAETRLRNVERRHAAARGTACLGPNENPL